ncbi:MAG: mannose-1-phosphate guanylyltransferase/mannose-6-phosphate isomerase [Methanomicrobiales archaeon]|jgi:mannose-1-phosphate guanylyltransferase/mannose-6-phosphate isomerase|nr:mannose-1-phosphate guanylyltransferase/mannose-6-phosphate isomerase [Methanomicrobiales archaeon]
MNPIWSVILAGGVGTRLWPLSRTQYPKQFIKLKDRSLFQEAFLRARVISPPDRVVVVTNEAHRYLVGSQVEDLGMTISENRVLCETMMRNTLPAIAWALGTIRKEDPNGVAGVFPSDHHLDFEAMGEIERASSIAHEYLVTFGIHPTHPATGYGYIAPGARLPIGYKAAAFKEKPDKETATRYMDEGYLWNSGMFLLSVPLFFEELAASQPDIEVEFLEGDPDYERLPSLSIDYGVLEKSHRIAVVPLNAQWSDLGSFRAWNEYRREDAPNDAGPVVTMDTNNILVLTPKTKTTAVIGISDAVIADTGDALLVCSLAESERVGDLVRMLKAKGDPIAEYHLQVFRPWGSYTDLERGSLYRIKRVSVKPGRKLSLQMHHHRSEHWIVVSGMADVILGDQSLQIRQGESTFVPAGVVHRLGNSGRIPLEVIEVQIGEYLEEDDITRLKDDYLRLGT